MFKARYFKAKQSKARQSEAELKYRQGAITRCYVGAIHYYLIRRAPTVATYN